MESLSNLVIYLLTFNSPKQFELWCKSILNVYPDVYHNCKKILINNTVETDVLCNYNKIHFYKDFDVITEQRNFGISGGRYLAAEHFSKNSMPYMIYFEDDMLFHEKNALNCKSGFSTYHNNFIFKSMQLIKENNLDYLKLSFSEEYGDNHWNWSFNVMQPNKRKDFFPIRNNIYDNKTIVDYTGSYEGLPFAVGDYFYCNWPLIFTQNGNKRIFLETEVKLKSEASWMLISLYLNRLDKLKSGCLLLSPIKHYRMWPYNILDRQENEYGNKIVN